MPLREILLNPKHSGLTGKSKPSIVIVSSPYGHPDSAVNFDSVKSIVEERGYSVLNKKSIDFTQEIGSGLLKGSISKESKSDVVLWLDSHGSPGWLFGADPTRDSELEGSLIFLKFINEFSKCYGLSISNIVLSCCYSGTEYFNKDEGNYFISPARALSILIPKVSVLGFIGKNSTAKVTDIYTVSDLKISTIRPLLNGSILFSNGSVAESSPEILFSGGIQPTSFLRHECFIPLQVPFKAAHHDIDRYANSFEECYGVWQKSNLLIYRDNPDELDHYLGPLLKKETKSQKDFSGEKSAFSPLKKNEARPHSPKKAALQDTEFRPVTPSKKRSTDDTAARSYSPSKRQSTPSSLFFRAESPPKNDKDGFTPKPISTSPTKK